MSGLPPSLERVVVLIDARPRDALTVVDLAAVVGTTPRALQKAFRGHLGCTPMEHVRLVRLGGAHAELVRAIPGDGATASTSP